MGAPCGPDGTSILFSGRADRLLREMYPDGFNFQRVQENDVTWGVSTVATTPSCRAATTTETA